jgi:HEPN domain-containing protein
MRERTDLLRGWLRKAESDLVAMAASLEAGSYDAACFHAQQAVEKFLKAFLIHSGRPPVHTHNLRKLVRSCAAVDSAFTGLAELVSPLTPYAVELRYDDEFWPSREVAEQARTAALSAKDFICSRLPGDQPSGTFSCTAKSG